MPGGTVEICSTVVPPGSKYFGRSFRLPFDRIEKSFREIKTNTQSIKQMKTYSSVRIKFRNALAAFRISFVIAAATLAARADTNLVFTTNTIYLPGVNW